MRYRLAKLALRHQVHLYRTVTHLVGFSERWLKDLEELDATCPNHDHAVQTPGMLKSTRSRRLAIKLDTMWHVDVTRAFVNRCDELFEFIIGTGPRRAELQRLDLGQNDFHEQHIRGPWRYGRQRLEALRFESVHAECAQPVARHEEACATFVSAEGHCLSIASRPMYVLGATNRRHGLNTGRS